MGVQENVVSSSRISQEGLTTHPKVAEKMFLSIGPVYEVLRGVGSFENF